MIKFPFEISNGILNYLYLSFINGMYIIFFFPFEISNGNFIYHESSSALSYSFYDNFHSKFRMEYYLHGLCCNRFC